MNLSVAHFERGEYETSIAYARIALSHKTVNRAQRTKLYKRSAKSHAYLGQYMDVKHSVVSLSQLSRPYESFESLEDHIALKGACKRAAMNASWAISHGKQNSFRYKIVHSLPRYKPAV